MLVERGRSHPHDVKTVNQSRDEGSAGEGRSVAAEGPKGADAFGALLDRIKASLRILGTASAAASERRAEQLGAAHIWS